MTTSKRCSTRLSSSCSWNRASCSGVGSQGDTARWSGVSAARSGMRSAMPKRRPGIGDGGCITADPSVMAGQFAGRQPPNNIIGEFRQLVLQRLGKLALAILDQRLAGRDTKDLLGTPGFTAHSIKREVSAVKELARQFARQTGDPAFANMVAKAMDAETEPPFPSEKRPSPQDSFPVQCSTHVFQRASFALALGSTGKAGRATPGIRKRRGLWRGVGIAMAKKAGRIVANAFPSFLKWDGAVSTPGLEVARNRDEGLA